MDEKFDKRFKELENRVSNTSERLAKLEGSYSELSERIKDLDKSIDALDKRIDFVAKITLTLTASVLAALVVEIFSRVMIR